MKKYLFLFIFLFMPFIVLAEGIDNYYIDATILDNGSLEVQEYFNLTGTYNGMERIINYRNSNAYDFMPEASSYGGSKLHNGSGIIIKEVMAVDADDNFSFTSINGDIFKKVYTANRGDYGVYTSNSTYDGISVKMFLPSYKNKAFYIKYVIKDIAILHNDIGELGWNAIGNSLSEDINNLVVTIHVPNNKDEIRVWAHGPLNGNSEIIDKNTVKASINYLNSNTAIDVRITFDKDVIVNSNKKSNVLALDKIVKYETDEAEKANYQRQIQIHNTINTIEEYFRLLNDYASRSTYDYTLSLIESLPSSDDKDELFNKLYTYKDKVDTYEYNKFHSCLDNALEYFNDYERAREVINNVFSIELQNKMKKELADMKVKIVNNEWKNEEKIILISIVTIIITVLVYRLYLYNYKKRKANVNPLYVRDIPSNLAPECVGLITDSTLNGNEITAAILDLIKRKIITYEKKDNGSYDLKFNNTMDEVTANDRILAKLIFKNKTVVNSKKIKKIKYEEFNKWKKQTVNYLEDKEFIKDYDIDKDKVNGNLLVIGIYFLFMPPLFLISPILITIYLIKKYKSKIFIKLFIYLNIILMIISLVINHFVHASIVISIIAVIVISRIIKKFPTKLKIKRTEKGNIERNKWLGLRNFLIDFSKIGIREIPELSLWEDYLIYATAFGIGKEVLNAMKLKIETEHMEVNILEDYVIFNSINDINNITSRINQVSSSAIPVAYAKTYMPSGGSGYSGGSFSSGSGSGGGFSGGSSGGGSFGGGGGGGRF